MISDSIFDVVKATVVETLGLQSREATITAQTLLFGNMPELDSLALVELITVLEERFQFEMDEGDITGDVFESVGNLAAYIAEQVG